MSRHTRNDGVTPDPYLTTQPRPYDIWWQSLGPPPRAIGGYLRGELPWDDFENAYHEHLKLEQPQRLIGMLATRAMEENVTVMCKEAEPDNCHRRLLVEYVSSIYPDVETYVA